MKKNLRLRLRSALWDHLEDPTNLRLAVRYYAACCKFFQDPYYTGALNALRRLEVEFNLKNLEMCNDKDSES
jgi:hypothetical protein